MSSAPFSMTMPMSMSPSPTMLQAPSASTLTTTITSLPSIAPTTPRLSLAGAKALTFALVTPATLVLLLSVSAAIVARSYMIRRRQRAAVEEAIRNGTYVPGLAYGFGAGEGMSGPGPFGGGGAAGERSRRVGKRPGLFDVWLDGGRWRERWVGEKAKADVGSGAVDWANLVPVSVSLIKYTPSSTSSPDSPDPSSPGTSPQMSSTARFASRFRSTFPTHAFPLSLPWRTRSQQAASELPMSMSQTMTVPASTSAPSGVPLVASPRQTPPQSPSQSQSHTVPTSQSHPTSLSSTTPASAPAPPVAAEASVAFLIAMPTPATSSRARSSSAAGYAMDAMDARRVKHLSADSGASSSSFGNESAEGGEGVPWVEFGIARVGVRGDGVLAL